MTPEEPRALIGRGESLTVEFKSDQRPLSDADLIETVVYLANGPGGALLIGVEDDGQARGVETMYRGQLRNGRRPPDYTLSTAASVSVILPAGSADLDFVLLAVQGGRRLGRALEVDELLALWQAHREGATAAQTLAPVLQREPAHASDLLTRLAQAGLLQVSRGLYRLAPVLYREAQAEQPAISPEEMILAYVQAHGRIARREAMVLCGLTEKQAEYRLRRLVASGELQVVGRGRNAHYVSRP
jgi:ATP-dependent DNA helicase RecG